MRHDMVAGALAILGTIHFAAGADSGRAAGPVIGFWGDRSGIYADAEPPVVWDYDTGLNILWHTPTPSFCYGAPTVLKDSAGTGADRVIYLSDVDPEHPFPLVVGLDFATGKECWRVEVNPFTVSIPDPAKRKAIEDLWRATMKWRGEYNVLLSDWRAASNKAVLAGRMEKLGMKPDGDMAKKGYPTKEDAVDPAMPGAPWTDPWKTLGQAGLVGDTWRFSGLPGGGWFFGEAFATPISDGERVFIQLAWGVWAAYDRDGKLLWMQHLPSKGGGDHCPCGRSPLIWRDLLIADLGDWVRAFDRATGREVWSCSRRTHKIGSHEMESPMVVTVAGKDYAYCNGSPAFAVRLEDGKPCVIAGPVSKSPGIIARTDPDRPDVLYLAGGGEHGGWENKGKGEIVPPAAIRLVPGEGDGLKGEVLWNGVEGKPHGSQVSWMICHQGRLYYRDVILDALTGKVLLGRPGARNSTEQAVPGSTLTLSIAGGRIYGQGYAEHGSEKRKDDLGAYVLCEVHDLQGHRLAVNRLRGLPGQAAMRTRNNIPNWYNYANNFTIVRGGGSPKSGRILSRSCNEVICIGEISRAYSGTELERIAPKLAGSPTLDAVLAHLDSPEREVQVAAAQAIAKLGATAAPGAKPFLDRMRSADVAKAEAGFLALCALGPNGGAVAADLARLARDPDEILRARARRALAAMGTAAVEALVSDIHEEAGYEVAMQIASLMEDCDAATTILARGLLGGKAPRFMKWLPPYERGQELTLRDIIPEALIVRGWRSKAGAELLLKALPEIEKDRDQGKFVAWARIVASADPLALVPHIPTLRARLKLTPENRAYAVQSLGLMGRAAEEALPDMEAWRADPKLDHRLAAQLDEAIARIKGVKGGP